MADHAITILAPGTYSTVQDLGRPGLAHLGIPAGGAADTHSHLIGNRLLGNPDNAASLEMTMSGARVRCESPTRFVVTGSDADASLSSPSGAQRAIVPWPVHEARAGDTITIGTIRPGARAYLCIAGGIDVPVVLASRSTLPSAGFGGHEGRPLRAGDRLSIAAAPANPPAIAAPPELTSPPAHDLPIRIICDEQDLPGNKLFAEHFTVSRTFSRAGLRLNAAGAAQPARADMVSVATLPGTVQHAPSGELIILGPDGPTTGGYPVLGCVARIDLPRIAQLCPGQGVRFARVSLADARGLFISASRELDRVMPPC